MVLVNSAELREISGFLYVTFLMPSNTQVVIKSIEAGVNYNEEAKRRKDRASSAQAKEADMDVDDSDMGPPHLAIGLAGIEALVADEQVEAGPKNIMRQWWVQYVEKAANAQQLALELKSWRCRKPKKPTEKKKGVPKGDSYAKLSFAVKTPEMEEVLVEALSKLGASGRSAHLRGGPSSGRPERCWPV